MSLLADAHLFLLLAAAGSKYKIQTLIFSKKKFTRKAAVAWAKQHGFKTGVDETGSSYRLRQRSPSRFDQSTFRTIKITSGISAVVGKVK